MPVNATASKLMRFGNQLVSLGGGVRYWVDSPDSGAEGSGVQLTMTLLFPRQSRDHEYPRSRGRQ